MTLTYLLRLLFPKTIAQIVELERKQACKECAEYLYNLESKQL